MDCLPHIHVAAIHSQAGYESKTPGVGALCRDGDLLVGAGLYSNSIKRASVYVAAGWQPLRWGDLRVGAVAGAVSGYGPVRPLAGGFVSYRVFLLGRYGEAHALLIPPVPNLTPATVAFSITFSMGDK